MRFAARNLAALAAIALALPVATGCGAPEELSREDARELADARERLDDAIDTEETLRTSKAEARRLRAGVREIVARGAFESRRLDEFGLAALGEVGLLVPSLVITAADGTPARLNEDATDAFLRFAESDPRRALVASAGRQVTDIGRILERADAGPDTSVAPPDANRDQTASDLVSSAERDTRPVWPELARRLSQIRDDL